VKGEEVLRRVKEERNILHTGEWKKANCIGHISRRNCLLRHVIEGKIDRMGRGGRERKQLVYDLKESSIYTY
jgi:hypothetical protein